ncbi:efflux transporter periplasmic adaptor subunit [PVC group bacterium]|nr:efflux transporter periplasmic adaptor subunit [PVC group bacterium]
MKKRTINRIDRLRGYWWLWSAITAVVVWGVIGKSCVSSDDLKDVPIFAARRGSLTISVTERGTIENREKVVVESEVEGNATIVSIVEEGTLVEKGDLLIELDSSEFEETRSIQDIRVQNSAASLIQGKESLAIAKNKAEADIEKAEYDLKFAKIDLKKYQEGDYPMSLQKADSKITLANEELKKSEDQYEWSEKLASKGFITQTEQLSDELTLKRKQIDFKTAQKDRDVLVEYTHERDLMEFQAKLKQSEMALERARRKARADIIKAEASLRASEAENNQQKRILDKLDKKIDACRIIAPEAGMVVYASSTSRNPWRNKQPLKVGSVVNYRHELIHLPISEEMNVDVRVQESSLRKVKEGLLVKVKVDAVTDKEYTGILTKIPVLPDATRTWLNPDLKIYNCTAELKNGVEDLRSGMSCRCEIIVAELDDVIYLPVQTVVREDECSIVYVIEKGKPKQRQVKTGMDNGRMICVLEGVEEGEQVLLSPPLQGTGK